jgi:hypothetical protein
MQQEELPARVRVLDAQAHGQLLQLEALMQQCELDIQAHAPHSEAVLKLTDPCV